MCWKNRGRKIAWLLAMIATMGINVTGCSTTELEERCFPMLVTVGYENGKITYGAAFPKDNASGQSNSKESEIRASVVADIDFSSSKEKYENRLNKEADYNHLKVLVLEDEVIEEKGIYEMMIAALMQTEDFPRNTYVCVADDVDDLYELEQSISQDLGTYLEEYIKKHEKDKGRLLTLGDLMNEEVNQSKILYLPYLDVEEKYIEWKGYMNTVGKTWQESK